MCNVRHRSNRESRRRFQLAVLVQDTFVQPHPQCLAIFDGGLAESKLGTNLGYHAEGAAVPGFPALR